jgi:hypothetical protein
MKVQEFQIYDIQQGILSSAPNLNVLDGFSVFIKF